MHFSTAVGMILLGSLVGAAEPQLDPADPMAIRVVCHGRLRHGVVAIGGETTGTTLTFKGLTWELKLPDEARRQFAEAQNKKPVTVTGRLRRVGGVEVSTRWIVEVERLAIREPESTPEQAEFVLTGTLSRSAGQSLPEVIELASETYPVVWGDVADLRTKAATFAGKRVVVRGSAEASHDSGLKKSTVFRIQQVQVE